MLQIGRAMLRVIQYFSNSHKVDHSRSLKMVLFESLGTVSCSHTIATSAVRRPIFSCFNYWHADCSRISRLYGSIIHLLLLHCEVPQKAVRWCIMSLKVIQVQRHRNWYQSKTNMRFPISIPLAICLSCIVSRCDDLLSRRSLQRERHASGLSICSSACCLFVCLYVCRQIATWFSQKLSNRAIGPILCLVTTYRKSYKGFSKNPLYFCWGWSDLDKISQTGAEWHVDCGDRPTVKLETMQM